MSAPPIILSGRGLVKCFRTRSVLRGTEETRALDEVDIEVRRGEVVALIGESGSGKTTLGKVLLRLLALDAGEVRFEGQDLFALPRKALRVARRDFQMVFQNQTANLHPKMTVRQMLDESLRLHRPDLSGAERGARAEDLMGRVGLAERANQRPASLSGGERRRAGLARILATRPKLIVADEPTSGLDAAIKLQTIELLRALKEEQMTYLLISHDLGLVRRIADRVLVMLKGRIIEQVPVAQMGHTAGHHPYTARLMRAANLDGDRGASAPHPGAEPGAGSGGAAGDSRAGCVYERDCQRALRLGILQRCRTQRPAPVEVAEGHWVACLGAESAHEEEV